MWSMTSDMVTKKMVERMIIIARMFDGRFVNAAMRMMAKNVTNDVMPMTVSRARGFFIEGFSGHGIITT